jgi:very-short-patch-repair endonuclease
MPHTWVSDRQRDRAKQSRQAMTRAETLLWRYIKAHRIEGLGFRRQVPMGFYVADFVCHAAKLVVELDGEGHDFESRQRRDRARDVWFEAQGYRVLRFTNDQVLRNLEGVVTVIRDTAEAAMRGVPPSLSLPHKGGGNPQTAALPGNPLSGVSPACGGGSLPPSSES